LKSFPTTISSIRQKNLWRQGWIAIVGLLLSASHSPAATIQNDVFWKDVSGNLLCSQSGTILKVGGTYYWWGNKYGNAVTYAADPVSRKRGGGGGGGGGFAAVTCYSSTDLVNWKFENNVLVPATVPGSGPGDWFGRMGVVYNTTTRKYVLIMEYIPKAVRLGEELFATSDTPAGNFTFDHIQAQLTNVVNNAPGDQTVFMDDDGKAYLVLSSSHGRNHQYVAQLRASDFLNIEPATQIFQGPGREGNCMFKYQGRYYYCSSNLHGWNASPTFVISATNIMGPYSPESVMPNTELDFSHVTQTGFFITVNGTKQTTVIFAGDRWSNFGGNGIGYNDWCPLSFNGTTPVFNSLSQWNLDATTGAWSVGPGNNYVLNPSFEADRVSQRALAGWTNTTNIQGADPNGNLKGAAHSGNFCMQQSYTTDYTAGMSQNISGIPDGSYTLTAWVKSSGGQNSAVLAAKNFGGTDLSSSIARPIADWTLVSIPGIQVTNGQCQVAIISDARANNWVQVDDISLVNSSAKPVAN
jgi:hypothetical protein